MDKLNFANTDNSLKYNDDIWMTIKENGNIGIGNENPSYTLDVSGSVNVSGNVKLGKISDLNGVDGTTPSKGEHLMWNDASVNWKPGMNTNWKKNNDNWYYDGSGVPISGHGSGVAIGREELRNWKDWITTVHSTTPLHNYSGSTYPYKGCVINDTYIVTKVEGTLNILLLDGTVKQTLNVNTAAGFDISDENRIIVGHGGRTAEAYIYELDESGNFIQTKTLQYTNSDETVYEFGRSVGIHGDYVIIGDNGLGTSAQLSQITQREWYFMSGPGAAIIFKRDSSDNWIQKQKLANEFGTRSSFMSWSNHTSISYWDAQIGHQVDIYENYAVITDPRGNNENGRFFIYKLDSNDNWNRTNTFYGSGAQEKLGGYIIKIYKNRIIASTVASNNVYIYELENDTWSKKYTFSPPSGHPYSRFALNGLKVDIHENYAIVGASNWTYTWGEYSYNQNSGRVYLLGRSEIGEWSEIKMFQGEYNSRLGEIVGINENIAFVEGTGDAGRNKYLYKIIENAILGIYNSAVEGNAHVENELHVGGNVGINVVLPEYKLHVNGEARTTSSWSTSDDRLKHNEQSLITPLETIMKLEPKHYFKTKELHDISHNFTLDASGYPVDFSNNRLVEGKDYTRETGIIAQDIQKILELAFSVKESNYGNRPMAVNYNNIHCTHIAATKELNVKLEALSVKNTELKAKNSELKESLEQIKQHLAN